MSILEVVKSFSHEKDKQYSKLYHEDGYEIGFGKGGKYPGHSHLYFYDIMFSPLGIELVVNGKQAKGNLLIVPPRTYMEDVTLGDFFFLKFSPTNITVPVPEKVDERLQEGELMLFPLQRYDSSYPFFEKKDVSSGDLGVSLSWAHLDLFVGSRPMIRICK